MGLCLQGAPSHSTLEIEFHRPTDGSPFRNFCFRRARYYPEHVRLNDYFSSIPRKAN
jgi:hypothetical protein